MTEAKVKISSIIQNQLPDFVKSEFPLVSDFLKQYYLSVENQGSSYDLIQNLDEYVKVDTLSNLIAETTLTSDVGFGDLTINVDSTAGFPDRYGLIQIDSEIITYISKTSTTFEGCIRGFSGITSLKSQFQTDKLVFSDSLTDSHTTSSTVKNLSILFLQEFFLKLKNQVSPGFEDKTLFSGLNKGLFVKQSKDFYSSKGTDNSFEILFRALYGKDVEVIKPRDFLIKPSDADYRETQDLVVKSIEGNVEDLINTTIYQDSIGNINLARGTVSNVEKITRGNQEYYILSLDFGYQRDIDIEGSIFGKFSIHPKSKCVTSITDTDTSRSIFTPSSTSIDVDSTAGFTNSGELVVDLENGTQLLIQYQSKTLNQFLDCTGITQPLPSGTDVKQNVYAYGNTDSGVVKFFITGVLSELSLDDNRFQKINYPIEIQTLGKKLKTPKANNWFLNIATKYNVNSIELKDSSDAGTYDINFYDEHTFVIGDYARIKSGPNEYISLVTAFNNNKSISVRVGQTLNLNLTYEVEKILSRVNSINYPELKKYTTNVQNIYTDSLGDLYVTSPSLPTYLNQPLKIQDVSKTFSGSFSGDILDIGRHSFYTGDSVYYTSNSLSTLGIESGYYFVKRIDGTRVKISRSRPDIVSSRFLTFSGNASSDKIELGSYYSRLLEPQKLIRKLTDPKDESDKKETEPGMVGVFVNGVEVLSYKSQDSIYYGPIEEIQVSSPGNGYDIINPPIVQISDTTGVGATAYASVIGNLRRIDIIDGGFNYIREPVVTISGGNGANASAKANLVSYTHSVSFNSSPSASRVDTSSNTISFPTDHKFKDHENVVYDPKGQTSVGGLTTGSQYFVSVQSATSVKLHKNKSDSVAGINTISLTSFGVGNHEFISSEKKRKIQSITIENSGTNYCNNKTVCNSSGISTYLNTINILNHGYKTGEILTYETTGTPISGLSTNSTYYVSIIDRNNFKLSSVGVGTISKDFYYKTNQFVDFKSTGSGLHIFNYEPISVTVTGEVGVSTFSINNSQATVQPIFRGNIKSVFVENGGNNYGSQEVLSYVKQPNITLRNGSGALLTPIIEDGKIVDVVVNSSGSYYNSPPDLIINGSGYGAVLTPNLSNGSIVSVNIISSGSNYNKFNTTVSVISAGSGSKFESQITSWKVNVVERYINSDRITDDDGFVSVGLNNFGLQYSHPYASRKLRSSVLGTKERNGKKIFTPDLIFVNNREQTSDAHSPIIGWAYDGNPIYGPYGYDTPTGGNIRTMTSGYRLKLKTNRPSTSIYPAGFFIEDYEYVGGSDLDEHNGRYCVTPEYPNGVYAYFTTINDSIESTGSFRNYKRPVFPYVIGNTYKSNPINYNFLTSSNQDNIDVNTTGWIKNTNKYNLTNKNSGYEFLVEPYKIRNQKSIVKSVSTGKLSSVGILSAGSNYKVDDSISFAVDSLSTISPKAKVSHISGKTISSISVATSSISNVEFYKPNSVQYIAISTVPHNFRDLDRVLFTANNDFNIDSIVNINKNFLTLNVGVGSASYTGIVTYFSVSGNLSNTLIQENDIYSIGDEQVKILNVDTLSSRIRVLRNQNGTTGIVTYSSGTKLTELPRKMNLLFNPQYTYKVNTRNKQYYFNPSETVGIGTTSGVGITSTLYFSNPGAGNTQVTIPTRSLYIPSHGLKNDIELIYSSGGGTGVSISTDGVTSTTLQENSSVYATSLSNDLIGISTVRVGLNSVGEYVGLGTIPGGLLYLTGVGIGSNHSFTTNYPNIITGEIFKNEVTVSTSSTHGLSLKDTVFMNVKSGITTNLTVKYNDYNRRLVISPRSFSISDVNVSENSITIRDHGYFTGQKVIHTSSSPSGGLENEKMYYVVVVDSNTIKLSSVKYFSTRLERYVVDITSASSGNILPINPPINLIENQTVVFDLSDSSLGFVRGSVGYSAFDLNFYTDSRLTNKFEFSSSDDVEITKTGTIGVNTDAKVSLKIYDSTPRILYYSLDPANVTFLPEVKRSIVVDNEVGGFNQISIKKSLYSGEKSIVAISSNTFSFISNERRIESSLYNSSNSSSEYHTNSKTAFGGIYQVKVESQGKYLNSLPLISSITSDVGTGALLQSNSDDIGKILSTEIKDIGFDYPSDLTLRPTAKAVSLLKISPQSSFKSIGISSVGKNYSVSPDLIVLDGLTNKLVTDVELRYTVGKNYVDIVKNTDGINEVTPTIIPINNPNGVDISSIVFNSGSKDVTVTLGSSFSDSEDFPFQVGEKVLVENISVGVGSTGKGFNSSNYNYTLFEITSTDPNIGGVGATVSYNISGLIGDGETTGTFDPINSSGRIIPQKHFPIFNITLKKNEFFVDEKISSDVSEGTVINWDSNSDDLKISTIDEFNVGDNIVGDSSRTRAVIESILEVDGTYTIDSKSNVRKGWQRETGFLDNEFQRIHDNDYYQYFSYDLKSHVPYDTWKDDVQKLNHTAGFKEFSNLVVESSDVNSGMTTSQNNGDFGAIADLSGFVDLNCVYDFDLVKENNINIDNKIKSNNIIFNSRVLQDYIESIGNRVLMIDDISTQFNDQPRSTRFSVVDTFRLNESRSVKYLTFVQDVNFTSQVQVLLISLVHDETNAYINQYGRCETYEDLGSFDFSVSGNEGNLIFYPTNYSINDYNISTLSFDVRDSISGVGSTNLGDSIFVGSATTTIPVGAATTVTVVGISSSYRTSKILVQIGAQDSSYYEFNELTIIHDGTNIYHNDYGQLSTGSITSYSSTGIGTYNVYYSGSDINVDLITNSSTSVEHDVNSIRVSIADTTLIGIGTETFNTSELTSHYTSIPSSGSPGITTIARFSAESGGEALYRGSYYIVSIEDLTNNQYQVSEVILCYNDSTLDTSISEFGIIQTNSSIGSIGSTVTSGDICLTFTPNVSTEVQVRVYQNAIGILRNSVANRTIDFTNSYIRSDSGTYTGTNSDIRRSFNLTHKGNSIFERYFNASSSDVIDITNNTIKIPDHFFVTGEEVKYNIVSNGFSTERVSIASTNIPGIGITDKLPGTLYIVKVDDLNVQVSASASEALRSEPNVLDLTGVGVGSFHRFISTNQNSKVIIGIDNLTQSPIVSTSVTTTSLDDISQITDRITFSGITSFFGGDLIQIDDEIMRISDVGIGSENIIQVRRGWLGTGISTHSSGSQITKVSGNYNIVNNVIHFSEAPYGLRPISSTTNPPDERDWVGVQTYSTFSGRTFIRSGIENGLEDSYSKNYIFDDISNNFNGISTEFTLKSSGSNISGFSTSNGIILINDIVQGPSRLGSLDVIGDYDFNENSGVTSITFTGSGSSISYDINASSVPRGGVIISVGSTEGFGYQPLVSAGGTAIVSIAGTIQSISIGNSGSGYRVGIQTVVNVGVGTSSTGLPNIEFIGTASVSGGHIVSVAITNPGSGYTSTNPPYVFFDDPLSYSNIPLVYSSDSVSGVGTEAKVDIVVGQGSSVINFEIRNLGYGYGQGDILTVDIGGSSGIPTNTSLSFSEFQITVDETFTDKFSGWTFGDLQVIDPINDLFDGQRVQFPIKINGQQTSIKSRKGSNIEVKANLLIFINDILQVPDVAYSFEGGSIITFNEPPKSGDTSKILFYKGTGSVDTQNVDILELVEKGDTLTINSDLIDLKQNPRLVYNINSTDIVETNVYPGPGISKDFNLLRPVTLCRQTSDKIINGQEVSKSRNQYEPLIQPTSNIIQNVSTASTQIFVESVKTFFDSNDEYLQDGSNELPQRKIIITSQDNLVSAAATAVVSIAGTISSVVISDGGVGYTTSPTVIIENPIGLGVTQRATATSTISVGGTVNSIIISTPGTGYTTTNPPLVLIESPTVTREVIDNVLYEGDFGIITGVGTTSVGAATTGITFDLFIPEDSFLRDLDVNPVGIATTGISGIGSDYYFVVYNSNIGYGVTSLDTTGSVIGVGSTFLDNVYQVTSVSIGQTDALGVGLTYVAKVTVSVEDYNGLTGLGYSSFYGEYSWGRIYNLTRPNPQTFNYYNNGIVGVSTSPKVQRFNSLRYLNYNT